MAPINDIHADLRSLEVGLANLRAVVENGIKMTVSEQKAEISQLRASITSIHASLIAHTAKDEIVFAMMKAAMARAIAIGFGVITFLVGIIGYLLTSGFLK